ncbi:hypothetical protein DXC85_05365 [Bifidobacterium longum]|uniref:Uncharacterized protein n=1 Tax=Bifidobacterium longum TaxID=216816 RepID=A0AB37LFR0_BIFLN|nr:hypothetical protein DXC85_05365 [Bifidobacterium longum]
MLPNSMGLFTVGLRDDDFEPAYNDVPDRRDGGRIQLAQARVRGMASTQPMISRGVGPRPSDVLSWVSRESEEPYE